MIPREPSIHYNPSDERRFAGRTQCGEQLAKVQHTEVVERVNCKRCLASLKVKPLRSEP